MAQDLIPKNSLLRAAEQVQAKRQAERAGNVKQPSTTAQIRARLNFIPDNDTLHALVDNALLALSRGVRWARGSIINLVV